MISGFAALGGAVLAGMGLWNLAEKNRFGEAIPVAGRIVEVSVRDYWDRTSENENKRRWRYSVEVAYTHNGTDYQDSFEREYYNAKLRPYTNENMVWQDVTGWYPPGREIALFISASDPTNFALKDLSKDQSPVIFIIAGSALFVAAGAVILVRRKQEIG